jgi:hypothetical protein
VVRSLFVLAGLAACKVPDVDLNSRMCPCVDGWTCDPTTQRCVQSVVDAAVDMPVAPTCPGFFCDDFESGDTSRWSGTSVTPTATLVVQTATVHRGMHALDGNVPAIADGSIAAVVEHFPAKSSGMIAARGWFYLPQPLIHFDSVITVFGAPNHYITVDADDTQNWTVTENGTASADHHSAAIAMQNAWVCVEVNYTFAPATITLYLGDVPIIDVPAVDTGPAYTEARVGVSRADAAGAHALTDDVVLATQHVGCN